MTTTPTEHLYLQLLEPQHVHAKGIGGKQALHLAIENGDLDCINQVLHYGASPNAADNNGVTPFHLSCHRNSLALLRLLLQKGADVNIVDNTGRGPIHYATQGGLVRTLHYLVEVCGVSLHQPDNNSATLLHIACAKKYKLVFNYLLRHQRSNLNAIDAAGNSVMHIAAQSGWIYACRRLLALRAHQLLHVTNCNGDKPRDVAKKAGHNDTAKGLDYYTALRWIKPRTDMLLEWYAMLFMPLVVYINSLLMANNTDYPTTVMIFMTILYGALHSYVTHRMFWIGGWSNPITAGLFAWGSALTILVIYQYVLHSPSRKHPLVAFTIVVVMSSYCCAYCALIRREQGVCTVSAVVGENVTSVKDMDGSLGRERHFCPVCEIVRPDGVGHCYVCGHCYYKRILHSRLLGRCITADNVDLYIIFIVLSFLVTVFFKSIVITQTDGEDIWWKLFPLIVGHYFAAVIHALILFNILKHVHAHALRRWHHRIADCYLV